MSYTAKHGDIIMLSFDPQAGHEQMGRRPAIVVSNYAFNSFVRKAAMVCPITNTDRGIPVQVRLDGRTRTTGVVMCDQAKILDLEQRGAELVEEAPGDIVSEIVDIIISFIEMPER